MNKWIEWEDDYVFECPYCKFIIDGEYIEIEEFIYCPKCGKRLIKEKQC